MLIYLLGITISTRIPKMDRDVQRVLRVAIILWDMEKMISYIGLAKRYGTMITVK